MKSLVNELGKRIALCIWGEWLGGGFGEKGPNYYLLINEEKRSSNTVILYFGDNEKCTIVNPIEMIWTERQLRKKTADIINNPTKLLNVKSADKITWEFYYYGKSQTSENLTVLEYTLIDNSRVHVIEKGSFCNRDEIINIKGKTAIHSF